MVIDVANEHGYSSSILHEDVCISQKANALRKSINPTILPSAIGK